MNIHIQTLYYLMENVNMYATLNEIYDNIKDIDERHLNLLFQIRAGDLNKVKELHQKGYLIDKYRDINIRLAIKYGNINIIYYLLENKIIYFDINNIIGQLSTPETYDILCKDNNLFRDKYYNRYSHQWEDNDYKLKIEDILNHTKKIKWKYKNNFYCNKSDNFLLRNHIINNMNVGE